MSANSSPTSIRPLIRPDASQKEDRHLFLVPTELDRFEQQQLDLAFVRPRLVNATVLAAPTVLRQRAHSSFEDASEGNNDELFARQPTPSSELPAAEAWSRTLAQAVAEVVLGKRPARQISRWVTPQLGSRLAEQSRLNRPPSRTPARPDRIAVRSVRVDQPADGVAEIAAVVQGRTRSRALMMRLEGWDGRWICTVAQLI